MKKKRYQISYEIQASNNFTEADIVEMVGEANYNNLKKENPGAVFKAYTVCNESVANPKLLDEGRPQPIKFGPQAVISALEKIQAGINRGLKLFWGHDESSDPNRPGVGKVIGAGKRYINNKLSAVVVGLFPSGHQAEAQKANGISMEAVWNVIRDTAGNLVAKSVEAVSGLAVFDRDSGIQPGFADAMELITIQAFNDSGEQRMRVNAAEITRDEDEDGPATEEQFKSFHSFRSAIRNYNVKPSDLWNEKRIVGRRVIKRDGNVSWFEGDPKIDEYIENEIIGPIMDQHKAEIDRLSAENADLKKRMASIEAMPRIEQIAREKKLPDRVIALAKENFTDRFRPGDDLDAAANSYLDQISKEDEKYRKIYSPQAETPANQPALGTPPASGGAKSPFLPEGEV